MDACGVALVTGASRGLGRAIAVELAGRGFDVRAGVRREVDAEALARDCPEVTPILLDVTELENFKPPAGLRVLVNNVGADDEHLPLEHDSMDVWRRVFETNVFGLTQLTQVSFEWCEWIEGNLNYTRRPRTHNGLRHISRCCPKAT